MEIYAKGMGFEQLNEAVRRCKPPRGLVQLLAVTEKQFAAMEYLVGECRSDVISTEERVLVL